MAEAQVGQPELPNFITILAEHFKDNAALDYLSHREPLTFSLIIIVILSAVALVASRRPYTIPNRLQNVIEAFVGGVDDFVCGILGPKGRIYTPFIGTLFLYIIFMNLAGIIPFMMSSTSSWSTTLALAICVFLYVQYACVREHGVIGYLDHLLGRPRGILAVSVVIPLMIFFLHIASELIRPISLSLRLRSNIWGDDMLLAVLAGFGVKALPLLLFNTFLAILAAIVQAVVFCLLTTIYFALALVPEE